MNTHQFQKKLQSAQVAPRVSLNKIESNKTKKINQDDSVVYCSEGEYTNNQKKHDKGKNLANKNILHDGSDVQTLPKNGHQIFQKIGPNHRNNYEDNEEENDYDDEEEENEFYDQEEANNQQSKNVIFILFRKMLKIDKISVQN